MASFGFIDSLSRGHLSGRTASDHLLFLNSFLLTALPSLCLEQILFLQHLKIQTGAFTEAMPIFTSEGLWLAVSTISLHQFKTGLWEALQWKYAHTTPVSLLLSFSGKAEYL